MTTIACTKDGMAADGLTTSGSDIIMATQTVKIRRVRDGRIFGISGNAYSMDPFEEFLNDGGSNPLTDKDCALVLALDGTATFYDGQRSVACALPTAIGSGRAHALTALDLGFDALAAVIAASRRDVFTGGDVIELRLKADG